VELCFSSVETEQASPLHLLPRCSNKDTWIVKLCSNKIHQFLNVGCWPVLTGYPAQWLQNDSSTNSSSTFMCEHRQRQFPIHTDIGDTADWTRQSDCSGRYLTVENVKQCLRQPKQVTETVETKIDEMSCQLHNLSTNDFIISYSQKLQLSNTTHLFNL